MYLGPSVSNFSRPEILTYINIIDWKIVGITIATKFIKLFFVFSFTYFKRKKGKKMQGIIEDEPEMNKITGDKPFIKFLAKSFWKKIKIVKIAK